MRSKVGIYANSPLWFQRVRYRTSSLAVLGLDTGVGSDSRFDRRDVMKTLLAATFGLALVCSTIAATSFAAADAAVLGLDTALAAIVAPTAGTS